MKKRAPLTTAFISVILFSVITGIQLVSLATANPYLHHEVISPPIDAKPPIISVNPVVDNTVYTSDCISLTLNVSMPEQNSKYHLVLGYIKYQMDWGDNLVTIYNWGGSGPLITDFSGGLTVKDIPDGSHNVTFIACLDGGYADGLTWYAFILKSYSTIYFSVDTTSPNISVLPIENRTCETPDVPLNFTVNEAVTEVSYSLDGQSNVTIAGNTTLSGLPVGLHNVTVYAWDTAGNVGASEPITFTIAEPEPEPELFPVMPVATASITSVAVLSAGLLVYFKKRKH